MFQKWRKVLGFLMITTIVQVLIAKTPLVVLISGEVQSAITFKIRNAEILANGRFEAINSRIVFNKLDASKIEFSSTIDVGSIKTGIRLRDKHLKSSTYFDVLKYPTIDLHLVHAKDLKNGNYEGEFKIRMKATEKNMTIPFKMREEDGMCIFEADFKINRRDYKVGGPSWTLAEIADVKVLFKLQK